MMPLLKYHEKKAVFRCSFCVLVLAISQPLVQFCFHLRDLLHLRGADDVFAHDHHGGIAQCLEVLERIFLCDYHLRLFAFFDRSGFIADSG